MSDGNGQVARATDEVEPYTNPVASIEHTDNGGWILEIYDGRFTRERYAFGRLGNAALGRAVSAWAKKVAADRRNTERA